MLINLNYYMKVILLEISDHLTPYSIHINFRIRRPIQTRNQNFITPTP